MRISTRVRYGVDAMLALAQRVDQGPLMLAEIAEAQGISRKYLHALLTSLKSAGLVRSIRGRGGGYELARAPGEITMAEVMEALEGPLILLDGSDAAPRSPLAAVSAELWRDLGRVIESHLGRMTLEDLVTRIEARETRPPMYYI